MKRIKQKLTELIRLHDEEIKTRKKFIETHGDRWRDSQKGREYIEKIDLLSENLNMLNDMAVELPEN